MNILTARDVDIAYNSKKIVSNLNITFQKPEIVSIIGPNGSGKSTILKAIGRLLKPERGVVLLDGKNIHSLPTKEVARRMAILPQGPQVPDDITVRDLVSYGRSPHQNFWNRGDSNDKDIIDQAIRDTHLEELSFRPVHTLSGGERQRAWIAMALAQKPEIMLLDEPTTFLDIHHQIEIMELLSRLCKELGLIVIIVIHDLNHAVRYSHRIIAVKNGKIFKDGLPSEVITEEILSDVFHIKAKIIRGHTGSEIICIPYGVCKPQKLIPD